MKEDLDRFVKNVKEHHQFCIGNEETTKQSLISPLFKILGWNFDDPREVRPQYRADFGYGQRAANPVDWAFAIDDVFSFIVEAKHSGVKLLKNGKSFPQQLSMYFNLMRTQQSSFGLGIYTNGTHWQFYTTNLDGGVMDKEPFLSWDILSNDPIPFDLLALLQRSSFQPQLIKTFAEQEKKQNLLIQELTKLLDPPDNDFIKLAIRNIESAPLTANVVNQWRPILVTALREWAKVKFMGMVQTEQSEKPAAETPDMELVEPIKGPNKECAKCGKKSNCSNRVCPKCKAPFPFPVKWYFTLNGKDKLGPVPVKVILNKLKKGEIAPDAMVLKKGETVWVPVSSIERDEEPNKQVIPMNKQVS